MTCNPKAWAATINTTVEPSQWLSTHQKEIELIMPCVQLRQMLALPASADMSAHTGVIESLTTSSAAGLRIFGSLSRAAASATTQNRINEMVRDFFAQDAELTEIMLGEWLGKMIKELEGMSCMELLPARRTAEIPFHNLTVKMAVQSLAEHLELAVRAQLRTEAFFRGLVEALPGEAEIFTNPKYKACKAKLSPCLMRRLKTSREYLREVVKAEPEAVDGQKVLVPNFFLIFFFFKKGRGGFRACFRDAAKKKKFAIKTFCDFAVQWRLQKLMVLAKNKGLSGHEVLCRLHGKKINRLDPWFSLDVKLLEYVTGPEGSSHLMNKFMAQCIASLEKDLSIDKALEASKALRASALFKWAAADTQSKVQAGHDMLVCVANMQPLPLGRNDDPWIAQVFANLVWFVKFATTSSAASAAADAAPQKQYLRGFEGLRAMWLHAQKEKECDVELLKTIATYRHLLAGEEQLKLDEMIASRFKAAKCRKSLIDGAVPPPAKKGKKAKKKQSVQEVLDDVADALLYGDD